MNKLIAVALLATIALAQQQPPSEKPLPEAARKLVELRYLTGPRAERASELIRQFMHPVGRVHIDSQLKSAILTGPENVVSSAEALLRKLDTPEADRGGAQVSLGIHLIEASTEEARGNPVPKVIEPAIDQMRKAFQYKSYRWIDTVLLVGRGGRAAANGLLPLQSGAERPTYDTSYDSLQVFEDAKAAALRNFRFQIVVPRPGMNNAVTTINSDLTIQVGQKLVVGKLSADQPNNAIFLVLTVEIQ